MGRDIRRGSRGFGIRYCLEQLPYFRQCSGGLRRRIKACSLNGPNRIEDLHRAIAPRTGPRFVATDLLDLPKQFLNGRIGILFKRLVDVWGSRGDGCGLKLGKYTRQ
jgi:hypothetical protein